MGQCFDRRPNRRKRGSSDRVTAVRRPLTDLSEGVRRIVILGALLAAFIAMPVSVPSASAALPEIEVQRMPEIEEWLYRNGAVKSPLPCGAVCTSLWNSEHGALPELASTHEVWDKLGALETGTGLWATMAEFGTALQGPWAIGATPFLVGWQISGEASKWIRIVGPTAPPVPPGGCGNWDIIFKTLGERVGDTFYEHAYSPGNEWYLDNCGSTELVGQLTKAENPESPGYNCGDNGLTINAAPWVKQEWWWNVCPEGYNKGQEVRAPVMAQAYYQPFHFGRPEDWAGQKAEGAFAHNIQTAHPHDPGATAVKEATERVLEESPSLRLWIQWVLEGEHGANPLGTSPEEEYGASDGSAPTKPKCITKDPVNCATGNEVETQTDLAVGGRGPGLRMTRTYNSQLAAKQTSPGTLGYGWTGSYSAHVQTSEEGKVATVYQDSGGTVRFLRSGEQWVAANPLVQAKLAAEGGGYLYTLPNQTALHFTTAGQLASEVDRNGNAMTMNRNSEGRLESISDPAGRKLTLAYNSEGSIESASDPMGHTVKYGYEAGKLASVTAPGETSPRWQLTYDASHRLSTMRDGRGGVTRIEYDSANRVISQTDPAERTLSFEYEPSRTKITNQATGAVTDEHFSADNEPVLVTHGYGTADASTQESTYDNAGTLASVTDGDKHTTKYGYDSEGNRTSTTDAVEHQTKWTYNGTHDVLTTTTPNGETTTIVRDSHGNAESLSRAAPGGKTQITKYAYDVHGEVETMTDPLEHVWKYEYGTKGDRVSETDPEGDKRTWAYDEDSRETSTVSPRGNAKNAEPAKFTTKVERDAQERPLTVTDPLGHTAKYKYDANGNLETFTDANSNTTTYSYNANDEPTTVKEPNGTITETGYDGAGHVTSETDGNKHTTKYARNSLEEVTEATDPLGRKTTKEYDAAGNLKSVTDAAKRATTYTYDPVNRLTAIAYSDGKTPGVKYEYDADGNRTSMVDGTGTTTYGYDQLDRLTESKDGHGDKVAYEYDVADEQTKITYPNGKAIQRSYDKAGRQLAVVDWLGGLTSFEYDPDSDLTSTTFQSGTHADKYTYNNADQMTKAEMKKGTEVRGSITYTRDNANQVKTATTKGLPGEEKVSYTYDPNERLAKANTSAYEYDAADNPTKVPGSTNTYDVASQLEKGTGVAYSYDEAGQRTKTTPTSGPATTYGYDQAGNLTSMSRPKEGETAAIEDTYAYDGNKLRASRAASGTTSYLTWDMAAQLPLLLNDGSNNYIYGPGNLPVEQITSEGSRLYLHHDQQGSTRMLTSPNGTVEGTTTYDGYGNKTGSTGTATTPLGYDGQHTNSDTGLIYLRARIYDPATAQFLSVDPLAAVTRAPYTDVADNPLNGGDPSGLAPGFGPGPSGGSWCGPFEEAEQALREQAEEMRRHHCHNNQVVIEGHCTDVPAPSPGGGPPPEVNNEPPLIPLPIPLPRWLPKGIPEIP
jgi:RHS repeat-associated protein